MRNTNRGQRKNLDERILDQVRQGPRTQTELIREVGEAESKIRSRLQFLDGAGYVEKNETGEYEFREDPEESGVFEEHPRLRWVAFAAVFLLSDIIYFLLLENVFTGMVPPSVAFWASLPFAWMTARVVVHPRFMGEGPLHWVGPPGS